MTTQPFPAVSAEAITAFREQARQIIRATVDRSLEQTEDVEQHGADAPALITRGLEFTADMLVTAMELQAEALIVDQLLWALDRLPHDQVQPQHVLRRFAILRDVTHDSLPEPYGEEVARALDWMVAKQTELMEDRFGRGGRAGHTPVTDS